MNEKDFDDLMFCCGVGNVSQLPVSMNPRGFNFPLLLFPFILFIVSVILLVDCEWPLPFFSLLAWET